MDSEAIDELAHNRHRARRVFDEQTVLRAVPERGPDSWNQLRHMLCRYDRSAVT